MSHTAAQRSWRSRSNATHLVGQVGDRFVGLPLGVVRQVLPMLIVEPMPGGPPALLGFATVGGEPLPVLRLRSLFAIPDPLEGDDQRIVVTDLDGRAVGLVFDGVQGVVPIASKRSPTRDDGIVALEVIEAIASLEGGLYLLLDPARVVSLLSTSLTPPQPDSSPGALEP